MTDEINIDLSDSEQLDWLHGEGEDLWEQLDDKERENRAFKILVDTVQNRLSDYGVEESVSKIAIWIDSLEKDEMRDARKCAINSGRELDYIDRVADALIESYLPVSVDVEQ